MTARRSWASDLGRAGGMTWQAVSKESRLRSRSPCRGGLNLRLPDEFTSVTVGAGAELVVPLSARILSDTDGDGDMEPVQGPNGLLNGTVTIDISGNQVFAQFQGTAQPAGFNITIEGLAPAGVAPGTIAQQGSMSGVNLVYAPTYDAGTKTLDLDWYFLGSSLERMSIRRSSTTIFWKMPRTRSMMRLTPTWVSC